MLNSQYQQDFVKAFAFIQTLPLYDSHIAPRHNFKACEANIQKTKATPALLHAFRVILFFPEQNLLNPEPAFEIYGRKCKKSKRKKRASVTFHRMQRIRNFCANYIYLLKGHRTN